jgi:hypothetical protein
MRAWIRKHRISAFSLAVLALACIAGILVFCYFNYCFTLRWANAPGGVDSNRPPFVETGGDNAAGTNSDLPAVLNRT